MPTYPAKLQPSSDLTQITISTRNRGQTSISSQICRQEMSCRAYRNLQFPTWRTWILTTMMRRLMSSLTSLPHQTSCQIKMIELTKAKYTSNKPRAPTTNQRKITPEQVTAPENAPANTLKTQRKALSRGRERKTSRR